MVKSWIHKHGRGNTFVTLHVLKCTGILITLGLAMRPGKEGDDIDDEGNGAKMAKLMEQDAF